MLLLIASTFLSLTIGFLITRRLSLWSQASLTVFSSCAAIVIGLGASTSVMWLSWMAFGWANAMLGYFSSMVVLCVALAIANFRTNKKPPVPLLEHQQPPAWAVALMVTAAVGAIAVAANVVWNNPHGLEDSIIVWNMRAKFLSTSGLHWSDSFAPSLAWSHQDYPLLLPLSIGMPWMFLGSQPNWVPISLSLMFAAITSSLLTSSVWLLRGPVRAITCGAVLLSTPFFIRESAAQMADIPLSCYMLATLAFLVFADRFKKCRYRFMLLAGITAGLAAWTKNEGILFLIVTTGVRAVLTWRINGLKSACRQMLCFAVGLILMLITLGIFEHGVAKASYFVTNQDSHGLLRKLQDPSRYIMILRSLAVEGMYWGNWLANPILFLIAYYAYFGINKTHRNLFLIVTPAAILVAMYFGYAFAYLITPLDLAWQLGTSLDRLYLQLWPSFLFVLALLFNAKAPVPATSKPEISNA